MLWCAMSALDHCLSFPWSANQTSECLGKALEIYTPDALTPPVETSGRIFDVDYVQELCNVRGLDLVTGEVLSDASLHRVCEQYLNIPANSKTDVLTIPVKNESCSENSTVFNCKSSQLENANNITSFLCYELGKITIVFFKYIVTSVALN